MVFRETRLLEYMRMSSSLYCNLLSSSWSLDVAKVEGDAHLASLYGRLGFLGRLALEKNIKKTGVYLQI